MGIPLLEEKDLFGFLLVFLRTLSMIAFIPIFGERVVPAQVKGILAFLLAFVLYPFLGREIVPGEVPGLVALLLGMSGEVLIGMVAGIMVRFIFAGVQFAGEMIGFQMGFSIANVIDPVSSLQVSLISQLQYYMAFLLFLALDGHHGFLLALAESFRTVPPLAFSFSGGLMEMILETSKGLFILAVKLSAPVIAVLVFTHVALGLVARTVPQINVFIVGFPIQIALGLLFLALSSGFVLAALESDFLGFSGVLRQAFRLMGTP
ncbi:MAG TPA: flagellar biosynthetic protein FliR [Syntrophales bacterium]|nr:flagellar biosynthetic protein FliR [Syntrophales bacterium]HPX10988.1 flagellar biosynthetic protein FliR [Syntrophales bacterium]HQB30872.1 flagellar biosynthetic protein FliR [Syntrophales bacterium]HQN77661.1 flagellar biosynthetic protein FliR [Syntrophales bacterium]HQQ26587.1 flagellar biosynthetic protein FliR [Syntrophales bacterium]